MARMIGNNIAASADDAPVRPFEPAEKTQQRCLAAARRPQDRHELSRGDVKINAAKHGVGPEGLGQPGNAEFSHDDFNTAERPNREASSQDEAREIDTSRAA